MKESIDTLQNLCYQKIRQQYYKKYEKVLLPYQKQLIIDDFFNKFPLHTLIKKYQYVFENLLLDDISTIEFFCDDKKEIKKIFCYCYNKIYIKAKKINKTTIILTKPVNYQFEYTVEKRQNQIKKREKKEEERQKEFEKELDMRDALFQIYCKYRSYGYLSPEDMIRDPSCRELVKEAGLLSK